MGRRAGRRPARHRHGERRGLRRRPARGAGRVRRRRRGQPGRLRARAAALQAAEPPLRALDGRGLRGAVRRGRLPADDRARAGPRRGARALQGDAGARRGRVRLDAERADARAAGGGTLGQPVARARVPAGGLCRAVREALRPRGAQRAVPRAQARAAPSRDRATALGRDPPAARDHRALLRPLRPRDLRARLRVARGRRPRPRARPRRRAAPMSRGRLAIVLHTHMPYVEGFGTWPFGEEWLWEAVATSYVPLLAVLDRGAPLTLSLTPVLCDQLEAPGALDRCRAFLADVRPASHRLDAEAARADGAEDVAREIERGAGDYARALDALPSDLLAALRPHAAWTSAATHAVLPLLATDAAVRLQVRTGVAAHRARFGAWRGGFWLPECGYAPWLDPLLEEAGVHAVCVDLTDVLGRGSDRHLRPIATEGGPLLVPIDRATVELVWSDGGYPGHGAYRDYHHRTARDHRPWANDGSVYDPERAAARARADGADFVARVGERVSGGGLTVCALDTELLGHWWHEGPLWLAAVLDAAPPEGPEGGPPDDALTRARPPPPPAPDPDPPATGGTPRGPATGAGPPAGAPPPPPLALDRDHATTWGTPRDLATWSGPPAAALAWAARVAELRVVAAGAGAPDRALRELLMLQSSDWAFLETRALAGPYPRERAAAHAAALDAALAGDGDDAVRNLAPHLCRAAFLEP